MTVDELLDCLFPSGSSYRPTTEQEQIIRHAGGPGWVLAGPGSGKTETLALFVLRLLYVDGDPIQEKRVDPTSIFATTFTEKAARNLEDRIARYRSILVQAQPDLANIDITKLRVGTLHSLCNDILQEMRAPGYQNVRLMDDLETALFVYENCDLVKSGSVGDDLDFWRAMGFMFSAREWKPSYDNLPNKWLRALKLVELFNRIVEARASVTTMKQRGGAWERLAEAYEQYRTCLDSERRCDFAHLQLKFREFLAGPIGEEFATGNLTSGEPGIEWVVVDEYQDTNLMQEEIYMTLAAANSENVLIVGDDDQAMYRFRGGSVECMVTFDEACKLYLPTKGGSVSTYPLAGNFRSHPDIVEFYDEYISAFPAMSESGARAPGKPNLKPAGTISGNYPAVGVLGAKKVGDIPTRLAEMVFELQSKGIIEDYSQCCLLLKSTRESPRNAGAFVNALKAKGIPVYNPRNRAFLEQEEVQALLGVLIALIDPAGAQRPTFPGQQYISDVIDAALDVWSAMAPSHPELSDYIAKSNACLSKQPGAYLTSNLQELLYFIMSFEPFRAWLNNAERRVRLGKLTQLIESYASLPVPDKPDVSRGNLRSSENGTGGVSEPWLHTFYSRLFGYIARPDKGLNEVEDETVIVPRGYFPIMTMHQSKGLEFPFVFVGHMGETAGPQTVHALETRFAEFPGNPARTFAQMTEEKRAELDLIRQYYVAYSRAEYALVLLAADSHLKKVDAVPTGHGQWVKSKAIPL